MGMVTYSAAWALKSRVWDAAKSCAVSPRASILPLRAAMLAWAAGDHWVRDMTGKSEFPFSPAAAFWAKRSLIVARVAPVAA